MPHTPRLSRAVAAAVLATLAGGTSTAAADSTAGSLVSRATGASGAPIAGTSLISVSRNGRFVLFYGPFSASPSGGGSSEVYLRDRVAGTTTAVVSSYSGPDLYARRYTPLALSESGKVLIDGHTDVLYQDTLTVFDPTTGQSQALTSGVGVNGFARFVGGDTAVEYQATTASGSSIVKTTLADGHTQSLLSGATLTSADAAGDVLTYTRSVSASRPTPPPGGAVIQGAPPSYYGVATGYLVVGQQPEITAVTSINETTNAPSSKPECTTSGVATATTQPGALRVADDGALYRGPSTFVSSGFPPNVTSAAPLDVGSTGNRELFAVATSAGDTSTKVVSADGTPALPAFPNAPLTSSSAAQLFANDQGIVRQETPGSQGTDRTLDGIYAYDPTTTVADPAHVIPTPVATDTIDTGAPALAVNWAGCALVAPTPTPTPATPTPTPVPPSPTPTPVPVAAPAFTHFIAQFAFANIGGLAVFDGDRFGALRSVQVGGKPGKVLLGLPNLIISTLPALPAGSYPLTVTTDAGTSAGTAASTVKYASLW